MEVTSNILNKHLVLFFKRCHQVEAQSTVQLIVAYVTFMPMKVPHSGVKSAVSTRI